MTCFDRDNFSLAGGEQLPVTSQRLATVHQNVEVFWGRHKTTTAGLFGLLSSIRLLSR
jgi:hypothetical protein